MAHVKRFSRIPMSKSMRDLCREEDYMFLSSVGKRNKCEKESSDPNGNWLEKQEERVRRRRERERLEQERQHEIEEQQKAKAEQWRSHVAELAVQREAIHAKLHRLREFRDFQKKVLLEELGLDAGSSNESINHLLMRL